jgi:superfamily II DNA or RNA helicase
MILQGTYTPEQSNGNEHIFCVSATHAQEEIEIPTRLRDQLDEIGLESKGKQMWASQIQLSETLFCLSQHQHPSAVSEELAYWIDVESGIRQLASEEQFFPGLLHKGDAFEARWILDEVSPQVLNALEGWIQSAESFWVKDQARQKVISFAQDALDSYVRLVINTKFSLKTSNLGKLLKFRPFYLHEEWFHQLCMEEHLPVTGRKWQELYEQLAQWVEQYRPALPKGNRLCFRLESPSANEVWGVRVFYIRSSNELIAWNDLAARERHEFLQMLSQISKKVKLFEKVLSTPDYFPISFMDVKQYVKETASQIRVLGHAALVPGSMLDRSAAQVNLHLKIGPASHAQRGRIGFHTLVDVNPRIALGNHFIAIEDLEKAATQPFVKTGDKWIEVNEDEVNSALEWINQYVRKPSLAFREALFLHAMEEADLLPVSIQGIETEGWVKDWFDQWEDGGRWEDLPTPDLFHGTLRPYQQIGMSWLVHLRKWGMGACLADDMGLGKTIQLLAYLAYCKKTDLLRGPFLLVCPTSVLGNWLKEVERFFPSLSVMIHHGADRLKGEEFSLQVESCDLILTTYSLVQRDAEELGSIHWDGVALDEAQHIKNAYTKQSRIVRKLHADHRIALTGTPVENRIDELWSIFEFLNPNFLGPYSSFRRGFILPIERSGDQQRMNTLKRLIKPFLLRRLKTDPAVISNLPEKIESKEYCLLTREQVNLYEQVVQLVLAEEGKKTGMERKGLILAAISKLKQICNHPSLFVGDSRFDSSRSGKVARLADLIGEMLSEGDRVLLFTQYIKMGHIIKSVLEQNHEITVPFLHGGVSRPKRDEMIERFQNGTKATPVLLMSLKAGGIGLNLTRANRVIHIDRWWNPAVENQATDRAYRIGQTEAVYVYKMICTGTIEEQIDKMMESKKELVSAIMTPESWVTELGSNELKELLVLRNEFMREG